MTDLERIEEIENIIGFKLEEVEPVKFSFGSENCIQCYSLNNNNCITNLSLITSRLSQIQNILLQFQNISELCLNGSNAISGNFISSFFKKLKKLDISNTHFKSYQFINDLRELVELKLSNNGISDISFLNTLKKLEILDIGHNKISNLKSIESLKNLFILDIHTNNIRELKHLNSLENLKILAADGNKINDLTGIEGLYNLTDLYLGMNNISELNGLRRLTSIESLYLSINNINDISSLVELKQLKSLDLSKNRISDFSCLRELKELSTLDLSECQIVDIGFINECKKLTELHLWGNKIKNISSIGGLKKLKVLNLSFNQIKEFTKAKELKNIINLNLGWNRITNINFVKFFDNLTSLDLRSNKITDFKPIEEIKTIKTLDLSNTGISDLSILQKLNSLTSIKLCANQIQTIPEWLIEMGLELKIENENDSGCINLYGNPIQTPPVEIVKQGNEAIRQWYVANRKKLNEIKVLLVGEAKAGKTSLMRRLLDNSYNPQESQTDGILIERFKFDELMTFQNQKQLHGITAYFWDFGGQEIMSSTHQFFMTKRSLYILVLEARKDEKSDDQVRSWMHKIKAFGGDSQVIIVVNKIDQNRSFSLDESTLRRDFPQIKDIIRISCANEENCDAVKAALEEYIPKTELFNTEIDERWFPVKDELQNRTSKDYYLPEQEFETICSTQGLTEESEQLSAVRFLNDLGMVLHFDGLKLTEFYVLDPYWVTSGVYRIITSDISAQQKGIVDVEQLRSIINNPGNKPHKYVSTTEHRITYSPNEVRYIADIMEKFKLCYYMDQGQKILIPDLLDKNTPTEECEPFYTTTSRIAIIYDYEYLPNTILPRFIVEMRNDIHKVWRTGVILKCTGCFDAHALVYTSENKIHIIVTGEYKQKREYLSAIRYCINNINKDYTLTTSVQIPLPGTENLAVEYEELLAMEQEGQRKYKLYKIKKEWEICSLLDGIAPEEEVQKIAAPISNNYCGTSDPSQIPPKQKPSVPRTVKIFLASSNELKDDRDQFEIFISRQNKHYMGNQEFFLQVELWEDFIDAMDKNRLQDAYNRTIKECDIFVILYWTKVGMYTAEEFEVAFGHFKETDRPLVYTYKCTTSFSSNKMNRRETNSLFDFEDKLRELQHFPKEYSNIDNLISQFSSQLQKILGKIIINIGN